MKTNELIDELVADAVSEKLIEPEDTIWAVNSLSSLLKVQPDETSVPDGNVRPLEEVLEDLVEDSVAREICGDSVTERDLFDTKIMGVITPRPSEVIRQFRSLYDEDPVKATDWYYDFSQNTHYIRRDRICKDIKWTSPSEYGDLEITINLSKPEKDPKAIAAAGKAVSRSYPKCQLCAENEGYEGRLDHPARQNHRIIPLTINQDNWYLQYSPYVYYNEHCIVFNSQHVPMVINASVFDKLFDFIDQFPHYFVGSNADLPIVGGSILSHEHFQGGHHVFPMEVAETTKRYTFPGYEQTTAGILHWPMSVIRLQGKDRHEIAKLADQILTAWRAYSDPEVQIYAFTDETPHNTITPIARKNGDDYVIDLVLRNNLTTDEYPLGLYHPHPEYHHIKKENIGLIEVMGLAVLPSRLKKELEEIETVLIEGKDIPESLDLHRDWIVSMRERYPVFTPENTKGILEKEVGEIFGKVLEDAGVYKQDEEGQAAFARFMKHLGAVANDDQ